MQVASDQDQIFQPKGNIPSPDRRVKLAVVIVNYKTTRLVTQCLQSMLAQLAGMDAKAIVVDNHSQDGSIAEIRQWLSTHDDRKIVELIESDVNGGFSAGNNIGIRASDADYYLLINSDTIVRPEAIATLVETADAHPDAGLIGPRLEWPDGTPQESCFRFPSPLSEFIDAAQTGPITAVLRGFDVPLPASDTIVEPPWISFACILVRREVFDDVGLMDDGFFMYYEDVEFCRRAREAGWNIIHIPSARVVHLRNERSPDEQIESERRRSPAYCYASRARYFYLAYGWLGLTLANIAWSFGRCVSKLRETLERRQARIPEKKWLDIWTNWTNPDAPFTNGKP